MDKFQFPLSVPFPLCSASAMCSLSLALSLICSCANSILFPPCALHVTPPLGLKRGGFFIFGEGAAAAHFRLPFSALFPCYSPFYLLLSSFHFIFRFLCFAPDQRSCPYLPHIFTAIIFVKRMGGSTNRRRRSRRTTPF